MTPPFNVVILYAFGSVVTAAILMNMVSDEPSDPGPWPLHLRIFFFIVFLLWPLPWLFVIALALLGHTKRRKF